MKRGRRYLAYSVGALAGAAAAGRVLVRHDGRRPDPARDDHLGSIRGHPRMIRGPRASHLYTEWFPAEGVPHGTVILTHGYCLTEAVWHYQKRDLAGGAFGLVTWDLPGHGASPPAGRGQLTLDVTVDALAKVIEEYANGDVVLVGHSLGGVITLGYLARHDEWLRDRVRGLVLISTPLQHFARAAAGRWPGASLEARILGAAVQGVVDSDLFGRVLGKDVGTDEISALSYRLVRWGFGREPSPTQVRFIRDVIASVPPEVRAETFRIMTGWDFRPYLPGIKVPTMVIIGGRDRLVSPHESRILAEHLPRGKALALPDAGHAAFLERPNRFNEELRRFARRRLDRPSREEAGSA
jgi:pimeloyl-ACP methyl ester carboxylesterase